MVIPLGGDAERNLRVRDGLVVVGGVGPVAVGARGVARLGGDALADRPGGIEVLLLLSRSRQ